MDPERSKEITAKLTTPGASPVAARADACAACGVAVRPGLPAWPALTRATGGSATRAREAAPAWACPQQGWPGGQGRRGAAGGGLGKEAPLTAAALRGRLTFSLPLLSLFLVPTERCHHSLPPKARLHPCHFCRWSGKSRPARGLHCQPQPFPAAPTAARQCTQVFSSSCTCPARRTQSSPARRQARGGAQAGGRGPCSRGAGGRCRHAARPEDPSVRSRAAGPGALFRLLGKLPGPRELGSHSPRVPPARPRGRGEGALHPGEEKAAVDRSLSGGAWKAGGRRGTWSEARGSLRRARGG